MCTISAELVRYNVVCESCDQVFTPQTGTALWWKAKKRADDGFLDAYCCSSEECGCDEQILLNPDAPYRVFGYDMLCEDFDIPCATFMVAMRAYLSYRVDVVFIKGVSLAVERTLRRM